MEVFLRGVPQDLPEETLRTELQTRLSDLNVTKWACQKSKQKSHAWVQFENVGDANKFLAQHGAVKAGLPYGRQAAGQSQNGAVKPPFRQAQIAKLFLLNTPIYVDVSTRPNSIAQSFAQLQLEAKVTKPVVRKAVQTRHATTDAERTVTCSLLSIACGKNYFAGNALAFAAETEFSRRNDSYAQFGRRGMVVNLSSSSKLEIVYESIEEILYTRSKTLFTLVLSRAPRILEQVSPVPGDVRGGNTLKWRRVPHASEWPSHRDFVSQCLVYQLHVRHDEFEKIYQMLSHSDAVTLTAQLLPRCDANQSVSMRAFEAMVAKMAKERMGVPFAFMFQAEALVKNNYINPLNGCKFLGALHVAHHKARQSGTPLGLTVEALKQVLPTIPYPVSGAEASHVDGRELLLTALENERALRADNPDRSPIYGAQIPEHQVWVYKARVTPTTIAFEGPEAESRNRVLRMFHERNDCFLRVLFCDEDGNDMNFNPKVTLDDIYARFRHILKSSGITVAGRHFKFLGFSHSSLRSHSVWFMANFNHHMMNYNRQEILRYLGDFNNIRVPAKQAARIGQAFSETPYTVPLVREGIMTRDIPDVKSFDGSRVFSDGVGKVSWDAVQAFWRHMPSYEGATCFQFRLGGYKGMLALDSTLPGKCIHLRKESMMKFPSHDLSEIGICDAASKPLRLVLNRQLIKILEDMGVGDQWFLSVQKDALDILRKVTSSAKNTASFISSTAVGKNIGFPKFIKRLDTLGIDYRKDPFLRAVVEQVVLRELRLLKHKARIPVHKGVTLFGVMDEFGFLGEGEVYVTFDRGHSDDKINIDGDLNDGRILVSRSPALHPGDIQGVRMRTPPQGHPLRELQNCIVFSQKGRRDLPSMLSGGDLDGDLYHVLWDERAFPSSLMYEPADYPRVEAVPLDRPVTHDDLADHFVNFMQTDCLGLIATRHLILADYHSAGTLDPSCTRLAALHSTAVDFSKTGIAVDFKQIPKGPSTRPDFMAPAPPLKFHAMGMEDHLLEEDPQDDGIGFGGHKPRYHKSQKILGKLYREVDEAKIWRNDIHTNVNTAGPSVWDLLLAYVGYEVQLLRPGLTYRDKLADAWRLRSMHEGIVEDKRWTFSDNPRTSISEIEVFCGFIINKRGSQTHRQRDSSIKLKEDMDRHMTWMVKLVRDDKSDAASAADGVGTEKAMYNAIELSWACLVVACVPAQMAPDAYHGVEGLNSFRVVAAHCLLRELDQMRAMQTHGAGGGGFVGVGGAGRQRGVHPKR